VKLTSDRIHLSFQNRLLIIVVLTVLIPLVIFGSFLTYQLSVTLKDEVSLSAQRELTQMADRLSLEFTQVKSISNLYYLDDDIAAILAAIESGQAQRESLNPELQKILGKYNAGLNNIYYSIAIILPDNHVIGNAVHVDKNSIFDPASRPWNESLEMNQSKILFTLDSEMDKLFSSPGYPYVYLIRQLHDRSTWEKTGTLIIGLSEIDIRKMYSGYIQFDQSTFILDENFQLISFADNMDINPLGLHGFREIFSPIAPDLDLQFLQQYSAAQAFKGWGTQLLASSHTINATQWKIVTIADLNILLAKFSRIRTLFFVILSIYLLVSILLSTIMIRNSMRPLGNLTRTMNQVKSGQLDARSDVLSKDEIGELTIQFNDMLDRIQDLVSRNELEQSLKREAEIMALQSQINPHFLYNTLASIRFMVLTGRKEDADTIILALIRLMKNTLSDANEYISIEKEIALLGDYLEIQKLAFGKELTYEIEIENSIRSCGIIKLLLQPIVENAILHGLKPRKKDCMLSIIGRMIDQDVQFIIRDNGVGFDSNHLDLDEIHPDHTRIGIANVNNRIKLCFGSGYGLEVKSQPGQGTEIQICIPCIPMKEDYLSYEHTDRR
jgi:two-component system sensor histidine kinase YesM